MAKTQKAIYLGPWDGFECIFGIYVIGQIIEDVTYILDFQEFQYIFNIFDFFRLIPYFQ